VMAKKNPLLGDGGPATAQLADQSLSDAVRER
jgi:hypothetical protein